MWQEGVQEKWVVKKNDAASEVPDGQIQQFANKFPS